MANNYESLKTDGHYTLAYRIFLKMRNWIIDFVKLEEVIFQVSDDCGVIKDLLYAMLRTTETYCNCIYEYNSYLKKYADFLNSLNIKDADMVAMMYKKMLDNGYLSYNKKHKYDKSFKNLYNKIRKFCKIFEIFTLLLLLTKT